MQLNRTIENNREAWTKAGYALPQFDHEVIAEQTKKTPEWIHFGAGNIFRAFQANVVQQLLNEDVMKTGIIVAEGYDYEIIKKMYEPHDNFSILVTLKADGSVEKTIVGSIMEALTVDGENATDMKRLREIFTSDSLKMVSFTITEKGYSLVDGQGELLGSVKEDFEKGPKSLISYMGKVTALVYDRYLAGKKPIALVSMDNCSHNGDKLYAAVSEFANEWAKRGFVDQGFVEYINNPQLVSYPWTMIDKITPRPDEGVKTLLGCDGIKDLDQVITSKNTYVAPFVNAEEPQYLVIEDAFPNGKLPLEKAGIIYTDRETVDKVEKMKVCTCLNPLHTALAVFGCLLGYHLISKEMENSVLKKLVETIGYKEGLPVVVDPLIIKPSDFIDEVINIRIPNPFMPDTPQRIATDTSQKVPIRFGETIKAYVRSNELNVTDLSCIPLVIAGWLRYLLGIDDNGDEMQLSSDPLMTELQEALKTVEFGNPSSVKEQLKPLLSDEKLFGCDLYKVGLGSRIETMFAQMLTGPGAVSKTLTKYIA